MKQANRFKLTPQVYKQLKEIAYKLPKLQKLGKNGEPLFRAQTDFLSTTADSTTFEKRSAYKLNIQRRKEPVLINHEVSLIDIFQRKGMDGVNKYIEEVNRIAPPAEEATE